MKYHSAAETALLIALLMKRSESNRGRISDTTIRLLSNRTTLRNSFLNSLTDALDDLGISMLQTERGFALIYVKSLNGAPALTAKRLFKEDLLPKLKNNDQINFEEIRDALDTDDGDTNANFEE